MSTRKTKRAQGLVEFGLLIPLFLFIIFVFIDLSRGIATYSQLSNSVREGTRYGIVHNFSETEFRDIVYQYSPSLDHSQMTVTSTVVDNKLTITASYLFKPLTPGMQLLIGGSGGIPMNVKSTALISPLYQ